jgi:transposase
LEADFAAIYAPIGWPSIAPEQLLRGLLLQAFYSVRSERQLMEQLDHNLLFRWFVGLGIDDPVWNVTVFTNIEEIFGWLKTIAGLRQTKFRGLARIRMAFTFALAAYNLIRMPKLVAKTA